MAEHPGRPRRSHAPSSRLALIVAAICAVALAQGGAAARLQPDTTSAVSGQRVIAGGFIPSGEIEVAFDGAGRSAVVAWARTDGVWMRRLSLETLLQEEPRRLMQGRGFVLAELEILAPEDGGSQGDLLVIAERGGHLLAQGFHGDGTPIGDSVRLSGGLRGVHSGVSTLVTPDSVVVAWAHVHRGQRVLVTRVDRAGQPLIERRVVRTPALQPVLAERPPAAGPGFFLDTLDPRGHALRTFDLDGEQLAITRFREDWRIALLPHDEESVLALSVVHDEERGRRLLARRVDGGGTALENLGTIGPEIQVGTRLADRPLGAAADRDGRVAVTYGTHREPDELLSLDLVLFGPDLDPRPGQGHRLAEGRVSHVSDPVWADEAAVLVAWHDAANRRIVLAAVGSR